ncbi:MAG: ABC transporter substrate-binding protein [Ferruginibacter sp.]|nr:ABC transporter substrate-binding protein [Chitinophagaceae bacterium]
MIKKFTLVIVLLIASSSTVTLYAQTDSLQKGPVYKVGIFAPLYLDSVFNKNTFKYRQAVPRFMMPAVDFVQGALIALDSLQAGEDYIDASVYDTRSYTENIADLIRNKKLDSLQLIIGSVRDEDFTQLAAFALQKNIPFISATYPNVAGVTENPFLVVMNSTLKSHCDAIYSYILQNHGTDKIYLCRQKGKQEDMVAAYFRMRNEQDGIPLLPIQVLNMDDKISAAFLKSKLDSNSKNIIIGGSLDETFAGNMAKASYDLSKTYNITLIGMPNWDGFSAFYNKKALTGFPVYFTTPFYTEKTDDFSKSLSTAYYNKYRGKPSDMAYKGYESVYLFTKLLAKYPDSFMSHISDKNMKVFCDYNFRSVKQNDNAAAADYFENKHLYLIKILNGTISRAW